MAEFVLLPREVLDDLIQKVDTLTKLVLDNSGKSRKLGDWIPENEARSMLNLKATSMWSIRKQGKVKWRKIGRQVYYFRPSIEALLEE